MPVATNSPERCLVKANGLLTAVLLCFTFGDSEERVAMPLGTLHCGSAPGSMQSLWCYVLHVPHGVQWQTDLMPEPPSLNPMDTGSECEVSSL